MSELIGERVPEGGEKRDETFKRIPLPGWTK